MGEAEATSRERQEHMTENSPVNAAPTFEGDPGAQYGWSVGVWDGSVRWSQEE